ncbi:MAG TPA: electron transfer flavoprotein subunit beta/FixA family protein [Clostridia bacterium]|jgi:electron transfer flavoprotein beta subunit|nr:electron transfer flavoprotein subunit beta/FixA family protein [Clostridia bacterium]
MNIIVCVKQVPGSNDVKMDKVTNTIIREGVEAIINPFDVYAVEEALKIKDNFGGKITAISMGIPKVVDTLQEVLDLGVDSGVLLSDRAFAGADSLATAYTLSKGINKIGKYDLIICGKQATDGDTAQVGPSLAEKLGIPHTTNVSSIEEVGADFIICNRSTDEGYEVIKIFLPAVITVVKDINVPRLPSIRTLKSAKNAEIFIWNLRDINADKNYTGLKGSPTQVVKTFIPQYDTGTEIFEGTNEEKCNKLALRLLDMKTLFSI